MGTAHRDDGRPKARGDHDHDPRRQRLNGSLEPRLRRSCRAAGVAVVPGRGYSSRAGPRVERSLRVADSAASRLRGLTARLSWLGRFLPNSCLVFSRQGGAVKPAGTSEDVQSGGSYLVCPRCRLTITPRVVWLAVTHCPRCLARSRTIVEMFSSQLPADVLYAEGSQPAPEADATTRNAGSAGSPDRGSAPSSHTGSSSGSRG
jgi:hypothetical protein